MILLLALASADPYQSDRVMYDQQTVYTTVNEEQINDMSEGEGTANDHQPFIIYIIC